MGNDRQEKSRKNEKKRWNNKRRKNGVKNTPDGFYEAQNPQGYEAGGRMKLYTGVHKECSLCNKPVTDLACALADKNTGEPVHFDCVLKYLSEHETLSEGQSIAYIGQGRFGVIVKTPLRTPSFSIERIIEWESREQKIQWRSNIAELYSCTK